VFEPLLRRVLHGPEPTGIVRHIVQRDAHGWSRRSLAVAGVTPSGGLELWLARLDDFAAAGDLQPVEDDAARAARIADPVVRSRHLVSRMLLRRILAERLGCDPAGLRFSASSRGKPVLSAAAAAAGAPEASGRQPSLHFNLSHAGGWLLVATSMAGPVGVDLEFPRSGVDAGRLARRVFSPSEQAALLQASEDSAAAGQRSFYDCWTRKEALLKCLGTGFAAGASAFDVGTGRGTVRVATPGHAIDPVCVASLDLESGHAAVAWAAGIRRPGTDDVIVDPVTARWRLEPAA
jgi:phosphopantetheinyl transferase